jgi:Rrf2 family protein
MDVVRRNTDYALRAMIYLAEHYSNGTASAKELARQGDIPYQLVCKLLQRLNNAKLVKSSRGARGGFQLNRGPADITVLKVIEVIQGRLRLNRCLLSSNKCPRQKKCPVRVKLAELQKTISSYLGSITLDELAKKGRTRAKTVRRKK